MATTTLPRRPWAPRYPRAFRYDGGKFFYRHTPHHSQVALRGKPDDAVFDAGYRAAEQSHRQVVAHFDKLVTALSR
jgi:hypothetical protein